MTLTPEALKGKVEELRALLTERIEELEDNPNWGEEEEREELADALDELAEQANVLRDLLQEGD